MAVSASDAMMASAGLWLMPPSQRTNDDLVVTCIEQGQNHMAADISSPAGDENVQAQDLIRA